MLRKRITTLLLSIGVTIAAAIPVGPIKADDTEIYLTTAALISSAAQPNVLIVLDTSGSMSSTDSTSPAVSRMERMKDGLNQLLDTVNNVNIGLMRFHYRGGPVLYPVADINADVCDIEGGCTAGESAASTGIQNLTYGMSAGADDAEESAAGAVTLDSGKLDVGAVAGGTTETEISVRITASVGDVEEQFTGGSTGSVNTGSSDLEMFDDGGGQIVGVHFDGVDVDQGVTIQSAYLTFTYDSSPGSAGTLNAEITAHASDDSPDFAASADIDGRTTTGTVVSWSDSDIGAASATEASSDIKTLVQALVNRAGWATGNAMSFIVRDDATTPTTGVRRFESRNGSVSKRPTLTIVCDDPATVGTTEECKSGGASDASLTVGVSGNDGDAEQPKTTSSSTLSETSSDLELVSDGSNAQVIGLRFPGVAVPSSATIVSASIEFEVDEDPGAASDLIDLDIYGESGASGRVAFSASTTATFPTSRTRTAARADWDDVPNNNVDGKLTTSNLAAVVQEVVSNAGWTSGEAMVFIMLKDPDSPSTGNRIVESVDGESAAAPLLKIKYETGGGGPTTNKVGIRFQQVKVPQGSTITGAFIDFTGGAADSDATLIKIHGEDVDDAAAFAATASNIGSRVKTSVAEATTGVVAWNAGTTPALDTWGVDTLQTSPDLKDIVQQIVGRSGWCGGNSMAFILEVDTGSAGKRTGYAFEDDPDKAPVLRVSYDADNPQTGATECSSSTIYAQPKAATDDAEEASDGVVSTSSSDLEIVQETTTQTVGVRFNGLPIPQGATIISADITFTADEVNSDATTLAIDGELADDSAPFATATNNITSRTKTSGSKQVAWSTASTPALASWTTVDAKHVTPDLKAIVQEIVDQSGWTPGNAMSFILSGTGKRVAKAIDGAASDAPKLRVTFQGDVADVTVTVRDRLHGIVDAMVQRGGTPVLGAMVEAAKYFRGEEVFYGKQRGVQDDADKVTRVSHAASYTGGTHNLPTGCPDTDSSDVACKTETISGTATYKSPIALACQESYIVLMTDGDGYITGGETGAADPRPFVDTIIGSDCGTGHDQCVKDLVEYLNDNDQITSASQVLASGTAPLEDVQKVHTYTVGFASDGDPTFLQALATLGEGEFKTADDADSLAAAFSDIIANILKTTTSLASPSLTVNAFNRLFHRDEVYFSLFEPDNNVLWPGNVKKYNICSDPDTQSCSLGAVLDADLAAAIGTDSKIKTDAKSEWSSIADGREIKVGGAGSVIPVNTGRKIYSDVGTSGVLAASPTNPVTLGADHEVKLANQKILDQLGCGISTDAACIKLVGWIRGVDKADEDNDTSTTDERWKLSDPLHSSPVAVTFGGTDTAPIDKVFVGANDGSVRMINAYNGIEEWSFIPAAMLDDQQTLLDNPEQDHVYGLDLTPSFLIVDQDGDGIIEPGSNDYDGTVETSDGDFVYMFIGMRRGGRNIYALDVTPSATLTDRTATTGLTPKFMWRIEGGSTDFAKLGYTFSKPVVTEIRVKSGGSGDSVPKTVLLFGGGYDFQFDDAFGTELDSTNSGLDLDGIGTDAAGEETVIGNAVYIVDPDDGSRIRWFSSDVPTSNTGGIHVPGMVYPIPSDLAVFDSNGDGESDRIYVGDVGGNLWRIDLDDQLDASGNGASVVGRLASFSTAGTAADERRFFHAADVVQVQDANFSDTARYDLVTIGSGYRAHPLSTTIMDKFYAVRDFLVDGMSDGTVVNGYAEEYPRADGIDVGSDPDFVLESDLLDVTDNVLQDGTDAEIAVAKALLKTKRGWVLTLDDASDSTDAGEKVLARPVILAGKVFFTTFLPEKTTGDGSACEAQEGAGVLYAVDVLNAVAVINFDETGADPDKIDRSDRTFTLGSGVPSPPVPIFQEKGVTLLVGSGGGAATVDPEIDLPRERTFWYQH